MLSKQDNLKNHYVTFPSLNKKKKKRRDGEKKKAKKIDRQQNAMTNCLVKINIVALLVETHSNPEI
jgi:hypothetical protein